MYKRRLSSFGGIIKVLFCGRIARLLKKGINPYPENTEKNHDRKRKNDIGRTF